MTLPTKRRWPSFWMLLSPGFWLYVFEHSPKYGYGFTIQRGVCRFFGHDDVAYYNLSGYEPDMRCLNCGEDLG